MRLSFLSLVLLAAVAIGCMFVAESRAVAGGGNQQNIIINNGRQGLFSRIAANRAARRAQQNIVVNNISGGGSYQQLLRSSSTHHFHSNQLNTFNVAPYTQSANIRFSSSSHYVQQPVVVERQVIRQPVIVEREVEVRRYVQPVVQQRIEYQVVPYCR